MSTVCLARSCGGGLTAPEIARGLLLCGACRGRLGRQLTDLPGLYEESEQSLEYGRRRPAERVSSWRPTGVRLDDNVVEMRSAMTEVLASWCLVVVVERGAARPGQPSVACLAAYLRAHLDWLGSHMAAADFAGEIDELVTSARDAFAPVKRPHIELGPCTAPGCDSVVRATAGDSDEAATCRVSCEAGHVWPPAQWLVLRQRIEQAGRSRPGAWPQPVH
jgi:hypothetical protein